MRRGREGSCRSVPPRPATPGCRRWVGLLVALGALVVTACTGEVAVTATTPAAVTTTEPAGPPQPATTTSGPAGPFPLARSRAEVPWSSVSHGWFLALYLGDDSVTGSPGDTVLYLVDSDGELYEVAHWRPDAAMQPQTLLDWSPGGDRVLVWGFGADGIEVVSIVDLATGSSRMVDTMPYGAANHLTARFTRPTGRNLVVKREGLEEGIRLERRSSEGTVLSVLVAAPPERLGEEVEWRYGLEGTTVFISRQFSFGAYRNDGAYLRELWMPQEAAVCKPLRWWSADTLLARCEVAGGSELWLVPAAGGTGERLAAPDHHDAWKVGDAIVLRAAGTLEIRRQDGSGEPIVIAGSSGDDVFVGADQARMAVLLAAHWDPTAQLAGPLVWVDLEGTVLGTLVPRVGGAVGVISALPFPKPTESD